MTETYPRAYTTLIWLGTVKDIGINNYLAFQLFQFVQSISPLVEFEPPSQDSDDRLDF